MLDDVHRLDRLVTRLLELSRVEADLAPLEVVDYEALVREAARGVDIRYASSASQVRGRRAHLAAAIVNLLDNARQHAAAGTAVTLRVEDAEGGRLRTSVHNRGEPVSPANLPRLWDRFFTTRADRGGTGLGLAIVASVARAHGGSVGVSSTAADGTTFWLDLPRA
jgi:two-component system sensor histidine kinase ChvG